MDLEDIMLTELSKMEKDIHHRFHLCMGSEKQNKQINITRQKQNHRYEEQIRHCQRGGGWGHEGNS